MKRMHEQIDPELRRTIRDKRPPAIIPIGSIEQHGPHLPVTTDTDIASAIAHRTAAKVGALALPAITYGVSYEHAPFFHASVRTSTIRRQIRDICDSLADAGIVKIILLNGHYGNQKALAGLQYDNKAVGVSILSYWNFMKRRFDHAGFVETSLMLAISDTVRMARARKGLDENSLDPDALAAAKRQAARSFPRATKNGVWGDPTAATAEDGRAILSELVRNLAGEIRRICI